MKEHLLTIDELCELLQVGRTTIWRWRKEGLPSISYKNSVRFVWEDVLSWLKKNNKK
jgi:excisionase family DNA binding protein